MAEAQSILLIVEDDTRSAKAARLALAHDFPQLTYETATSLMEARERLKHRPLPRIVLLDLGLPGVGQDKLAALKAVRAVTTLPIVVIWSGRDDVSLAMQARDLGAFDFIVKGADEGQALVQTIGRALALPDPTRTITSTHDIVVLLVDDDPAAAELIRQVMVEIDYCDVVWARSRKDAIAECVRYRENEGAGRDGFDVVLLDMHLPGEAHSPETAVEPFLRLCPEVAIVVVTGDDSDATLPKVFAAGAHGFLSKNELAPESYDATHVIRELRGAQFRHAPAWNRRKLAAQRAALEREMSAIGMRGRKASDPAGTPAWTDKTPYHTMEIEDGEGRPIHRAPLSSDDLPNPKSFSRLIATCLQQAHDNATQIADMQALLRPAVAQLDAVQGLVTGKSQTRRGVLWQVEETRREVGDLRLQFDGLKVSVNGYAATVSKSFSDHQQWHVEEERRAEDREAAREKARTGVRVSKVEARKAVAVARLKLAAMVAPGVLALLTSLLSAFGVLGAKPPLAPAPTAVTPHELPPPDPKLRKLLDGEP